MPHLKGEETLPTFAARGRAVFQEPLRMGSSTRMGFVVLEVNEHIEGADKIAYEIAWCMNQHKGNFHDG
jgi:hypothetical protein